MIRAIIKPLGSHPELSVQACRAIIQEARAKAALSTLRSRKRALRYAHHVREQSAQRGYRAGVEAARADLREVAEGLRSHYGDLLELAQRDSRAMALLACEELIGATFANNSATLLPWLNEALEIVKRSRDITIYYHPRYERFFRDISPTLPTNITVRCGDIAQLTDFAIRGELGQVEFAWRETLQRYLSEESGNQQEAA